MDGQWIVALAVACFTVVIPLWALIDIIRRPHWQWEGAEKNRQLWLILMIVSIFFFFGGILIAVWYLLRVQPHLKNVRHVSTSDIYGSTSELPPDDPRARALREGGGGTH
jgi:hypothetical protein